MFKGEELEKLLNQRPPILMVDALYNAEGDQAEAGLTIDASNIFVVDGELTEAGVIEHIAQSASAFVSYRANQGNAKALLGFIGEVKKLKFVGSLPQVGQTLKTTISITSEVMGITLFTAKSKVGEEVVVECQMKLSV